MIAALCALLVCVLLVAIPQAPEAACAWVLWPKRLDGDFVRQLLVYDTRQQCESSRKDFIKGWDPKEEEEQWPVAVRRAHPGHWRCLPDTVDPRGPKGGGR